LPADLIVKTSSLGRPSPKYNIAPTDSSTL
jgi:hypothetical protein